MASLANLSIDEIRALPSELLKEGLEFALANGWNPTVPKGEGNDHPTIPAPPPDFGEYEESLARAAAQCRLDAIRENARRLTLRVRS